MHDNNPHAKSRHEDDIDQQVPKRIGMLDNAAAEFYDGGRIAKFPNPTESLDQRIGLLNGLLLCGTGLSGAGLGGACLGGAGHDAIDPLGMGSRLGSRRRDWEQAGPTTKWLLKQKIR